jgi:hypothetical protein
MLVSLHRQMQVLPNCTYMHGVADDSGEVTAARHRSRPPSCPYLNGPCSWQAADPMSQHSPPPPHTLASSIQPTPGR